ncbi:hypothetical protein Tco_0417101 [Tanacetum coccineum]
MESPGFARYWSESESMIPGKGDLHDYWRDISTNRDFLGPPPYYTLIKVLVLRLCHRMMAHSIAGRRQAPEKVTVTDLFYLRGLDVGSVNIPYLLARYLRRFAAGRKSGAYIFGGQFVARLAEHFGLLTTEVLGGLTVIALELLIIDMAGAPVIAEDVPAVDEGDQCCIYLIKPGSKFSTIVHEYTEPSRIFTLKASMEKRDDFKCVEAEDKSNLKTSL